MTVPEQEQEQIWMRTGYGRFNHAFDTVGMEETGVALCGCFAEMEADPAKPLCRRCEAILHHRGIQPVTLTEWSEVAAELVTAAELLMVHCNERLQERIGRRERHRLEEDLGYAREVVDRYTEIRTRAGLEEE